MEPTESGRVLELPPLLPPCCRCNAGAAIAVRRFGRWWCAGMDDEGMGGCGFEFTRPPALPVFEALQSEAEAGTRSSASGKARAQLGEPGETDPPLCTCGRSSTWSRGRFWCDSGVCRFEVCSPPPQPEPAEPTWIRTKSLAGEVACSTATMLTASAYGPVEPFCFVSPKGDCGLGLFARATLVAGQFVGEYGGPRLPSRLQTRGQCAPPPRT